MDKDTKKSLLQVTWLSTVGIAMAAAIFGSLFIGVYLDGLLGTGHILTIVLLLMGIIAGFKNFFTLVKRYGMDGAGPGNRDDENFPEGKN